MDPVTLELRNAETRTLKSTFVDAGTYVLGRAGTFERESEADEQGLLHVTAHEQKLLVSAIDHTSLLVNGKPASGPTPIQHGDWVTIANVVYQVGLSHRADAQTVPVPKLAVTPALTSQLTGATRDVRRASMTGGAQVLIGRHQGCALIIDSPLVSREHARLTVTNGQWQFADLGSINGSFVNGRRVREPVLLNVGDRVGIATFLYRFTGDGLRADGEEGRVRIEALGITKIAKDRASGHTRKLLDDISLVIEPGEFVVIFGGSGSGKSTLLDTLNGRRPATTGRVLYNGVDFYSSFDMYRSTIGYVPQQDIVHRRLKMRRALEYTARLRLPADTAEHEIATYLDEVLASVRLQEQAELLIDTPAPLSGASSSV